jgi:hypothetical protein
MISRKVVWVGLGVVGCTLRLWGKDRAVSDRHRQIYDLLGREIGL